MRRKRWILGSFFLVVSLLLPAAAFGQTFDLDPKKWFPLEVGNAWHYRCCLGAIFTDWILFSERDTLVDDQSWVRFAKVACMGPGCSVGSGLWYRMTDDLYVVIRDRNFSVIDTLDNTIPRSIFTVNQARDSTLQLLSSGGGNYIPVVVSIEENTLGQEADSTHLTLHVTDNRLFDDSFLYNIGRGNRGEIVLVGALVNGKAVGDTTWIRRVVRTDVAPVPSLEIELVIYPNPFRSQVTISMVAARFGHYELSIYNVLGQRLYRAEAELGPGQRWNPAGLRADSLPSGLYVVNLARNGTRLATRTAVHLH